MVRTKMPKYLMERIELLGSFEDGEDENGYPVLKWECQLKRPYSFDDDKHDPWTYAIEYSFEKIYQRVKSAVKNEEGWKNRI